VNATTKNLLILCDHLDMVIAHAPGAAAVGSLACVVHTLSLPPVSPREHKMIEWQHDGKAEQWVHLAIYKEVMERQAVGHAQVAGSVDTAEMTRAMDAARQCEIVADNTQALNVDWGKIYNPWENARPRRVKRWGEGQ